jgi:arylsulfatase A-like enzyme
MPWNVPRKYYDMHPLNGIELPPYREDDLDDVPRAGVRMARPEGDHKAILESGRWKDAVQGYLAAISYADAMIGRLLDAFDKSAYATNTIICFWCDHGWHLGEKHHWRKFALWEEATRSPLIWVVPGLTKANSRCDRTVDFMTIYPTLMDLCGLPTPAHIQGESIRSLLTEPNHSWNRPAITTYKFKNHAIRSEDWRYIRYGDGGDELYDETNDPYEWTNLAKDPAMTARKESLVKWLPTTNAPDIGGNPGSGAEEGGEKKARKKKQ